MPAKIIVKMNVTNHAKAPAASQEAAGVHAEARRTAAFIKEKYYLFVRLSTTQPALAAL